MDMEIDLEEDASVGSQMPGAKQTSNGVSERQASYQAVDTYRPLEPWEIYQHDFLLRIQRDLLSGNSIANITTVVIGVFVLTAIVIFGVEALNGTPFDLGAHLTYTIRALLQTLCFPAFAAIYLLLPNWIANLFNTLKENGVIGACKVSNTRPDDFEDFFIPDFLSWIDNKWWSIAGLGIVLLFWLYRLLLVQPQIALLKQAQTPLWAHITILLLYSPMIYCVFLCIVRLIVTLVFTNMLFHQYQIDVNPLSPDGYGGLGKLDRMLAISTCLMVTLGIAALVMNSSFLLGNENPISRAEAICLALGYFALAPTLIVGWILLPHQVMLDARYQALKPLANEYEELLTRLTKAAPAPGDTADTITSGTNLLTALQNRYNLVQSVYPVWPTTIQNLRSYVATLTLPILIPIVLPLLGGIVAYLTHLFGG